MNEEQIKTLIKQEVTKMLGDYTNIPLEVENAFLARGFTKNGLGNITGIVKANGLGVPTAITPVAGTSTVYVAASSGGAVTTAIIFTDGVRTT